MRRDSWRSVPRMCRPPSPRTSSPSALHDRVVLLDDLGELLGLRVRIAALLLELELRDHLRVAAEDDVGAATGHVRARR